MTAYAPFNAGGGIMLWVSIAAGLVAGAYVTVVRRFLEGFKRTSYRASSRLQLAVMWPVLMVFGGKKFREEFARAVMRLPHAAASPPPPPETPRDGIIAGSVDERNDDMMNTLNRQSQEEEGTKTKD